MRVIPFDACPFVPASHEDPAAPGVWKKVLLQKADIQPGRIQMVNWARLHPGKHFAPHYHEDMQELFVILTGVAKIVVGAQTATLRRGDAILIDARETHEMSNVGEEDVDYLAIGISRETGGRTVVVEAAPSQT